MRPIKGFKEYIEEHIVKRQAPDKSRSMSLIKESEKSESFLRQIIDKVGLTDDNANTMITIAYDIIMKRIRAHMVLNGYNTSGQGAHESEVSYLRELKFNESDIQFCDQLRYFRNGIMYYGKTFDKTYAEKIIHFMKKIKKRL